MDGMTHQPTAEAARSSVFSSPPFLAPWRTWCVSALGTLPGCIAREHVGRAVRKAHLPSGPGMQGEKGSIMLAAKGQVPFFFFLVLSLQQRRDVQVAGAERNLLHHRRRTERVVRLCCHSLNCRWTSLELHRTKLVLFLAICCPRTRTTRRIQFLAASIIQDLRNSLSRRICCLKRDF